MNEELLHMIAITSIRNYLNRDYSDEEIEEKFIWAVEVMKEEIREIKETRVAGVTQISQGSQSMSFNTTDIYEVTPGVAALLPKPAIRLF
ncbi:hypothetical protein [Clostridium sp.]|uniref:hypothetical protein n=1 Tax=Clostridium sp. TaxID=1506 RepID=UPI003990609B